MAQFDVYRNASPATKGRVPYLLDVQSDLLSVFSTRVVVPLVAPEVVGGRGAERLNPVFTIARSRVVMLTTELAGVPRSVLGAKVGTLAAHRVEILGALDVLLTGV